MSGWDIPGMLLVTLISNIKLVLLTDTGFPSEHYKAGKKFKRETYCSKRGATWVKIQLWSIHTSVFTELDGFGLKQKI